MRRATAGRTVFPCTPIRALTPAARGRAPSRRPHSMRVIRGFSIPAFPAFPSCSDAVRFAASGYQARTPEQRRYLFLIKETVGEETATLAMSAIKGQINDLLRQGPS